MQLIPSPHTHSAQDKKRILLKQQQQRLLLLRHASRCTVTGTCRATPHCAEMKRLWKHMSSCRKPKCDVPHCVSSRYVLSHYRKCNKRCEVCTPVREAIRGKMMAERQFAQARAAAAAAQAGGAPGNKRRAPSGTNDAARFANRASGTKRQRRSSVGGAPGGSDPRAAGKIPLRYPTLTAFVCSLTPAPPPCHTTGAMVRRGPGGAAAAAAAQPKRNIRIDTLSSITTSFTRLQLIQHVRCLRYGFNARLTPIMIKVRVCLTSPPPSPPNLPPHTTTLLLFPSLPFRTVQCPSSRPSWPSHWAMSLTSRWTLRHLACRYEPTAARAELRATTTR